MFTENNFPEFPDSYDPKAVEEFAEKLKLSLNLEGKTKFPRLGVEEVNSVLEQASEYFECPLKILSTNTPHSFQICDDQNKYRGWIGSCYDEGTTLKVIFNWDDGRQDSPEVARFLPIPKANIQALNNLLN